MYVEIYKLIHVAIKLTFRKQFLSPLCELFLSTSYNHFLSPPCKHFIYLPCKQFLSPTYHQFLSPNANSLSPLCTQLLSPTCKLFLFWKITSTLLRLLGGLNLAKLRKFVEVFLSTWLLSWLGLYCPESGRGFLCNRF